MPAVFIDARDVATLLGFCHAGTFLLKRGDMERRMGLPRPVPYLQRPLKWRHSQISAWLEEQGQAARIAAGQGPGAENVVMMRKAVTP